MKVVIKESKISAYEADHLEIKIYFPGGSIVAVNHQDGPGNAIILTLEEFDELKSHLKKLFDPVQALLFSDE